MPIACFRSGRIAASVDVLSGPGGLRFVVLGGADGPRQAAERALARGDVPSGSGFVSVLCYPDGTGAVIENGHMRMISAPYCARGEGWPFAYGAMAAGADPQEAVEIAQMFSGGVLEATGVAA